MATGKFERELRGVMSGDKEDIDSVTNTCGESTTEKHEIFKKYPFFVTRAAGSLGTDLLAVRGTLSFLIEVKAYKKDKIYLSDQRRLQKQREQIIDTATQCDIVPLYAYRLKGETGEKWSVFTLNIYDDLSNDNKDVMLDIPALTPTKSSHKMVWDEGLMLSDFAELYGYRMGEAPDIECPEPIPNIYGDYNPGHPKCRDCELKEKCKEYKEKRKRW